jgi:hypothetical protein
LCLLHPLLYCPVIRSTIYAMTCLSALHVKDQLTSPVASDDGVRILEAAFASDSNKRGCLVLSVLLPACRAWRSFNVTGHGFVSCTQDLWCFGGPSLSFRLEPEILCPEETLFQQRHPHKRRALHIHSSARLLGYSQLPAPQVMR